GTVMVQLAPPARVPPVKVKVLPPVMTMLPPQVDVVPLVADRPAGRTSVKEMPVRPKAPVGLVIRKLALTLPFKATFGAANDAAIVGGGSVTVRVAVEGPPEPALLLVTRPVLLFQVPGTVPFTV